MKVPYKTLLASILLVLVSFVCSAQFPDPPPPAPPVPPNYPIDGFSWLLIVSGVIYGARKGYKMYNDD